MLALVYSYSIISHKEHGFTVIRAITNIYFWTWLFTHIIYAVCYKIHQHLRYPHPVHVNGRKVLSHRYFHPARFYLLCCLFQCFLNNFAERHVLWWIHHTTNTRELQCVIQQVFHFCCSIFYVPQVAFHLHFFMLALVYSYSIISHKEHGFTVIRAITNIYFWTWLFTHIIYAVCYKIHQHLRYPHPVHVNGRKVLSHRYFHPARFYLLCCLFQCFLNNFAERHVLWWIHHTTNTRELQCVIQQVFHFCCSIFYVPQVAFHLLFFIPLQICS